MKTIFGFGRCFDKLVKEFVVNITLDCNVAGSAEFRKVYVRGKLVNFSPILINSFLGRSLVAHVGEDILLSVITNEIIVGQVKAWPKKGMLSTGTLSDKYALLNRIGAANWLPNNHSSHISTGLARLIYMVGTKTRFDFGTFVFGKTMKYANTLVVKLPISFPSLLSEIILSQHPKIVVTDEYPVQKASPLTFDQRLYIGTHVQDIEVEVGQPSADDVEGSRLPASPGDVLAELVEISKTLQDTIVSCTQRKKKVDLLIKSFSMGKTPAADEGNQADVEPSAGTSSDSST